MNLTFQVAGLLWSCLVALILTPFALTKWLTQIFVDCNRFNKGEVNEVRTEWPLKAYRNKRRGDETRTTSISQIRQSIQQDEIERLSLSKQLSYN